MLEACQIMYVRLKERVSRSQTYNVWQSRGAGKAVRYLLGVIRYRLKDMVIVKCSGYILEADLNSIALSDPFATKIGNGEYQFKLLGSGEKMPAFCYGIGKHEIVKRQRLTHQCYVVKSDGRILCSAWVGFGRVDYSGKSIFLYSDDTTFYLEPAQAWLYDVICRDGERNKGLGTALLREIVRQLKMSGHRWAMATVGLDNVGSIKAFMRSCFRLRERVFYTRVLGFGRRRRGRLSENDNQAIAREYGV